LKSKLLFLEKEVCLQVTLEGGYSSRVSDKKAESVIETPAQHCNVPQPTSM